MARKPRDPQRQALDWTDAELDAMTSPEALASPESIAEARAWWRRNADPRDAGPSSVIDPEPVGEDDGGNV